MSIAVQVIPTLNVVQISVDGQILFLGRGRCTEFLAAFMRAMADSSPEGGELIEFPSPGHSVRVGEAS